MLRLVVGTVDPVTTSFAAEKEIGDVVKSASDKEDSSTQKTSKEKISCKVKRRKRK